MSNFINGIHLSNGRALDVQLVDIERIEVPKGPQSEVYGRKSFAGVSNARAVGERRVRGLTGRIHFGGK